MFETDKNDTYFMFHNQLCCENVRLVNDDNKIIDLIGSGIFEIRKEYSTRMLICDDDDRNSIYSRKTTYTFTTYQQEEIIISWESRDFHHCETDVKLYLVEKI